MHFQKITPSVLAVMCGVLVGTGAAHAQPGTVLSHQKISDTEGGFTGTLDNVDRFGTSVALLGDLDGGGGVLSSWIIGKTNRFKAAVVAKPVINWISFALTADMYTFFHKYWFSDYPWAQAEEYWRRSPLSLVGNVSTPTMLLTGEADYRAPISESEQY